MLNANRPFVFLASIAPVSIYICVYDKTNVKSKDKYHRIKSSLNIVKEQNISCSFFAQWSAESKGRTICLWFSGNPLRKGHVLKNHKMSQDFFLDSARGHNLHGETKFPFGITITFPINFSFLWGYNFEGESSSNWKQVPWGYIRCDCFIVNHCLFGYNNSWWLVTL